MKKKGAFSLDRILTPEFVQEDALDSVSAQIQTAPDPLAYIVANGYAVGDNFYHRVAQKLGVSYLAEIPLPLDVLSAYIQRFPLSLLTQYTVYLYEEKNALVLATSNPFLPKEAVQEILSYTPYTTYTFVLTHPNSVKNALLKAYRVSSNIVSEDTTGVFLPYSSAKRFLSRSYRFFALVSVIGTAVLGLSFFFSPYWTAVVLFCSVNAVYFFINITKMWIFLRSIWSRYMIHISKEEVSFVTYEDLPYYTLLIPLKNETSVVNQIVQSIYNLDYPKDKLDVKFAVEITDEETVDALQQKGIGVVGGDVQPSDAFMQLVRVPTGTISTKPRSCNFALKYAKGRYTVIYDAEDIPDKDQLKKAYLGFFHTSMNTICIQAKLNFYNTDKNLLTSFFSLEYGFWFDYFLPGLGEARSPLPLGGTSNHFVTSMLQRIGTWDPYNVTEDADLGLRIAKLQYQTVMMDSYTLEEANSSLFNWIYQRTRWQKGFLITFLLHMNNPILLYQQLGFFKFGMVFVTFGANYFLPFFNPFLWTLFILSFLFPGLTPSFPWFFLLIGAFNLIIANLFYIFFHFLPSLVQKRYRLALLALFIPLYWPLISIATYRALWQFIQDPYKWEKTKHGL